MHCQQLPGLHRAGYYQELCLQVLVDTHPQLSMYQIPHCSYCPPQTKANEKIVTLHSIEHQCLNQSCRRRNFNFEKNLVEIDYKEMKMICH